ncbi:MAG TPA: hypothetical protein VH394_23535 [Thermoanaerobaculia bacterium]|jgi:transcriptional regulator with XRE-family HTH domain|nr:hypothetical protein [Thermoanaerobaculia bacterium]
MSERIDPEDMKDLIRLLARGEPETLAAAAGLDPSSIYRYQSGPTLPRPRTLARIIAAAGLSPRFVHAILLPAIAAARLARTPLSDTFLEDLEAALEDTGGDLSGAALARIAIFLAELEDPAEPWERPAARHDRQRADDLRVRLEDCSAEDRLFLIRTCPEYQTPALAQRLRETGSAELAREVEATLQKAAG